MGVTELTSNFENLWNHIGDEVSNGWFVPSRVEWYAFGDFLYTKAGVTTSNYSIFGLRFAYWSSSMRSTTNAWLTYFCNRYTLDTNVNINHYVRLAKTL